MGLKNWSGWLKGTLIGAIIGAVVGAFLFYVDVQKQINLPPQPDKALMFLIQVGVSGVICAIIGLIIGFSLGTKMGMKVWKFISGFGISLLLSLSTHLILFLFLIVVSGGFLAPVSDFVMSILYTIIMVIFLVLNYILSKFVKDKYRRRGVLLGYGILIYYLLNVIKNIF